MKVGDLIRYRKSPLPNEGLEKCGLIIGTTLIKKSPGVFDSIFHVLWTDGKNTDEFYDEICLIGEMEFD